MRRIERDRDESREEMLNEDGRGIEWMKKVEWRRRTMGDINKNKQMLPSICYLALAFALK
jgi:hypothetical protein